MNNLFKPLMQKYDLEDARVLYEDWKESVLKKNNLIYVITNNKKEYELAKELSKKNISFVTIPIKYDYDSGVYLMIYEDLKGEDLAEYFSDIFDEIYHEELDLDGFLEMYPEKRNLLRNYLEAREYLDAKGYSVQPEDWGVDNQGRVIFMNVMKIGGSINESDLPFEEKKIKENIEKNSTSIRKFFKNLTETDLKWHTDDEDRVIKLMEGNDWFLQLEDQLPKKIEKGKQYKIPKGVYHRLLRVGNSDLVLEVQKKKGSIISEKKNKEITFGGTGKQLVYKPRQKVFAPYSDMAPYEKVYSENTTEGYDVEFWAKKRGNNPEVNINEIYRPGSFMWALTLNEKDRITEDMGYFGLYENEYVPLDLPSMINEKQAVVFVKENNGNVKKIIFDVN
jgi:hypothetical protein